MTDAKEIIAWLKSKLGDDYYGLSDKEFWVEHDYAFGDTESGFSPAYTINYEALEAEMDKWIAETFPKDGGL